MASPSSIFASGLLVMLTLPAAFGRRIGNASITAGGLMTIAGKFRVAADRIQEMIGRNAASIIFGGGGTAPPVGMRSIGPIRT